MTTSRRDPRQEGRDEDRGPGATRRGGSRTSAGYLPQARLAGDRARGARDARYRDDDRPCDARGRSIPRRAGPSGGATGGGGIRSSRRGRAPSGEARQRSSERGVRVMSTSDSYVRIFDTTLRDGEQSPGVSITLEEKLEIARALRDLKVDAIEAGFPMASIGVFDGVR